MAKYSEIISRMTVEQKALLVTATGGWSKIVAGSSSVSAMTVSDGACGVKIRNGLKFHGAPTTRFPSPLNIARTWNLRTGAYVADTIAKEARALGVNALKAPEGGVMSEGRVAADGRHFSEDPYLAGKMLSAYIKGYQHSDVMPIVGMDVSATVASLSDEKSQREIVLEPYEMAVKEGGADMISIPTGRFYGVPTCESKHLVSGIIGTEWQYDGIIASEDNGSVNMTKAMALGASMMTSSSSSVEAQRLAKAVNNHKRILENIQNGSAAETVLSSAMSSGEAVPEALLDEALEKLFCTIEPYEIDEVEMSESYSPYPFNHAVMFDEQKHGNMAYEAALESLVLLKNNGVLPIKEGQKTAFVGEYVFLPLATCKDEADFIALDNEITARMLSKSGLDIIGCAKGYARGAGSAESVAMLGEARQLAVGADVVVVYVGDLAESVECNGRLPEYQVRFLTELRVSTSAKIVAVYFGRNIVNMEWDDICDAVILAGDIGQGGAKAVLKVLSGAYNPSGKLTQTVCDGAEPVSAEAQMYGYRMCQAKNIEERYPFGHGLSYTQFEYSDIKVSARGVGFRITNTGDVAGDEIAQVYIGREESAVTAVRKELKGFAKVHLEAKESKFVEIPFDSKAFRYYNTETHSWETEGGYYQIYVASSSRNIRLIDEVSIPSSGAKLPDATAVTQPVQQPTAAPVVSGDDNIPVGKLTALIGTIAGIGLLAMLYFAFLREEIFFALGVHRRDELLWDIIFVGIMVGGLIGATVGIILTMIKSKKQALEANMTAEATATAAVISQTEYKPDTVYPDDWKKIAFPDDEEETVVESLFNGEETTEDAAEETEEPEEEVIAPSECVLTRHSSFDTLEAGVGALGAALCKYVAERRITVDTEELTELFAAVAASRVIAVRSGDAAAVVKTLEGFGEFFDASVTSVAAQEEDTSVISVLRNTGEEPCIMDAVNSAAVQTDKMHVVVLFGSKTDDLRAYLGGIMSYTGNSSEGHELRVGESELDTVTLPSNMWFVAVVPDDRATETGSACVVRLHADATEALDIETAMAQDYENDVIDAYTLTCHTLSDIIERAREVYYLSEKYWRKIDKLEEHIGASIPFALSNKTVNAMEKFIAVCVGCGIEQTAAMDCVLAALVLDTLSAADADKLGGDETLTEFMDSVFGADKDDRSREAVRLKGIK